MQYWLADELKRFNFWENYFLLSNRTFEKLVIGRLADYAKQEYFLFSDVF